MVNHANQTIQRVLRTKKQARTSYDRLSHWYDVLAGSETKFSLAALEKLSLQPGERLLEIGCGTGRVLPHIGRSLGQNGRACAVDLSGGMLAAARRRLARQSTRAYVSLVRADAAALPFTDACFDVVFLGFTLELFDTPEIPVVLGQCRRVLRRGGRIGVAALERTQPPDAAVRIYEWFHARLPVMVDCRPIHTGQALEAAGFSAVEVEIRHMWGLPVAVAWGTKV